MPGPVTRRRCATATFLMVAVLPYLLEPLTASAAPDPPATGIASIEGDWSPVGPPAKRDGHTTIHDPVRNRMLVFGGRATSGQMFNDVWAVSLDGPPTWTPVITAGTPPSRRYSHTAIYDPAGDRMIVFGGDAFGQSYQNDVWALDLSGAPTWTQLGPTGDPPALRKGHIAIYDAARNRMVVYGGSAMAPATGDDVWALSLSGTPAWTQVLPLGIPPARRQDHAAIYDPLRDRMIVFGGFGISNGSYLNDVWELPFEGTPFWAPLSPGGAPPGRFGHSAIYDAPRDRMVVFGGRGSPTLYLNDLPYLSLAGVPGWHALNPGGALPAARVLHQAIYDPGHDRMVVFAGHAGGVKDNDLWELPLASATAWSALHPTGNPPGARAEHSAIHDPVRRRMVVFGGLDGPSTFNSTAALALTGEAVWTFINAVGTPPSPRSGHSAIYDPVRDRMVVFGGYDGVYQNDVWALSFAGSPQWTLLTPIGVPPPGRTEHTAIYDPIRDRMVVFGGMNPTRYNDVWELTLGDNPAWSMISAAGTPPSARWAHCSIYDPVSDRMIAFAGYDGAYRNDLWGLSLGGTPTWSPIGASGTPPINGNQRTAVYDPFRDRMIVFGGGILGGSQFTSALGLAEDPAWTLLTTAPLQIARYSHAAIFDPDGDRMLVYGGQNGPTDETWALTFTGVVAAPPLPVPAAQARVERVTPNPSRGSVVFELGLAPGEPRAVEIFDLRGNRVWRTDPAAAASRIAWDGRRGDGSRVPAGIYFARLAGAPAPAARFVILR